MRIDCAAVEYRTAHARRVGNRDGCAVIRYADTELCAAERKRSGRGPSEWKRGCTGRIGASWQRRNRKLGTAGVGAGTTVPDTSIAINIVRARRPGCWMLPSPT